MLFDSIDLLGLFGVYAGIIFRGGAETEEEIRSEVEVEKTADQSLKNRRGDQ